MEYAFSVTVESLTDDQMMDCGAIPGSLGGGTAGTVSYVDFEIETDMPDSHVDAALHGLIRMGIEPRGIDLDPVTISRIAKRTGTSRQGVRMWVTGERRNGFPAPVSAADGDPVWWWSDVYPWIVDNGLDLDEDYYAAPLPTDTIMMFNGYLADPAGSFRTPHERRIVTGEIPVVVGRESRSQLTWANAAQIEVIRTFGHGSPLITYKMTGNSKTSRTESTDDLWEPQGA